MRKLSPVLALAALAAGASLLSTSASACPAGYHKVWIQGNPVCAHDTAGNNTLKANGGSSNAQLDGASQKRLRRVN